MCKVLAVRVSMAAEHAGAAPSSQGKRSREGRKTGEPGHVGEDFGPGPRSTENLLQGFRRGLMITSIY